MRHGLPQRRIDAGLPALPGSLEGIQNIGIHSPIQVGALDSGGGSSPATLDDVGGLLERVKCILHEYIYCIGINLKIQAFALDAICTTLALVSVRNRCNASNASSFCGA
jgi:hypothetical protein